MMLKRARASSSRSGAANMGDLRMAALVIGVPFLVGNGKAGFIRSKSVGQFNQPRVREATDQANKAFPWEPPSACGAGWLPRERFIRLVGCFANPRLIKDHELQFGVNKTGFPGSRPKRARL